MSKGQVVISDFPSKTDRNVVFDKDHGRKFRMGSTILTMRAQQKRYILSAKLIGWTVFLATSINFRKIKNLIY
jgi:hypothetical protein